MPKSKKFAYPPLQEVAFEVSFLPKLKVFDNLSDFQETIANDYPHIGEEQVVSLPMPLQVRDLADRVKQRLVFENSSKTKMIRISVSSFNFVEKSYDSFTSFSKELKSLWRRFQNKMGDFSINRIGLRYINRLLLPCTNGAVDVTQYTNPYYDVARFEGTDIKTIQIEARLVEKDKYLNVRSGILGEESRDGQRFAIYLLDYDCYEQAQKISASPTSRLNSYHSLIERRFLVDIKKPYKNYMKEGIWA